MLHSGYKPQTAHDAALTEIKRELEETKTHRRSRTSSATSAHAHASHATPARGDAVLADARWQHVTGTDACVGGRA